MSSEATLVDDRYRDRYWVLLTSGVATFMSALDGSVVNTVLPVIAQQFHSSLSNIEWVVTVYLLVLSGLLLGFGRLGDIRGQKRVFQLGFLVFLAGSALSGVSASALMLIAFRAFQALGGAMLSASSPAILTKNFPARQRGQALGLQATLTYLGLTIGPSLGGWLADQVSWRAVFYINVPVAIAAFLLTLRFVPADLPSEAAEQFDWSGALLFLVGLTALLLGLNQGSSWGWGSLPVLGMFAAAVLLLGGFLWLERRVAWPMLDLTLFRSRIFSASAGAAVFNYACVYCVLFLLPFYLIDGRGLSPGAAGLLLTAEPLVMAVIAPLSGILSDRVPIWIPSTFGMGVLAGGLLLLSRLGEGSTQLAVVVALAVSGFGIGAFISPNSSALMGSASANRQGIAAGMLATARNVGMVLGVGFGGAVYTTVFAAAGGGQSALFVAIRTSFLAAVGLALLGMALSSVRAAGENSR
ncbi:MAG: DHA2 family efflux MFS transporter permease subunit [Anaerolineales bacterium]